MQQCNDRNLFYQISRTVLSMILRQTDLTDEQIEAIRIDKVRRWRDGINTEELTIAACARIVGEPVDNLYRCKADPKVHLRRPKTARANKWTPELKKSIKRCAISARLGVS